VLFFYKAAVEKAKSTETDKVREAMRGLQWNTPQGTKTHARRRPPGDAGHVRREGRTAASSRSSARSRQPPPSGPTPAPASEAAAMLDWLQFVLAPQVVNGLSIGVAVVLMALGLTIIFGLLDVINMAHGEFYAIGAYAALALIGVGLPFWWALVLTPLLMAVVGYATERVLIQRVFHSRDRHTLTLLLTFGIAIILEDLLKIVFGANPLRIEQPITGATEMFGLFFPNYRLFLMAVGALVIGAVWVVVFRTRLGAMVRAAAFDRHMAASLGVPVSVVYAGTFAFGVALAGCRVCCWRRSTRSSRPWAATSC
jgi:branched-subunit amino acid ABC-type transport system permease component